MAQLIFTFTVDSETEKAVYAGNIGIELALQLLQSIMIADTAQKAAKAAKGKAKKEKKGGKN